MRKEVHEKDMNGENGYGNIAVLAQHEKVGINCFGALTQKCPTMLMY